ncbi:hypothetical protein, partial [[Ruminococcus] lactaris]|uniref:hypothetical protein n=2 Tax=[Ruminococcus] lactaris TaxID=46228 RepID=UPI001D0374D8
QTLQSVFGTLLLMHLLRNTLLSAGSRSKKFFSDSTAYSLNNANLKRIEKSRMRGKFSDLKSLISALVVA